MASPDAPPADDGQHAHKLRPDDARGARGGRLPYRTRLGTAHQNDQRGRNDPLG